MISMPEKERKTAHIRKDLHKKVKLFAVKNDIEVKRAYDRIIKEYFEIEGEGEKGPKTEVPEDRDTKISEDTDLQDLNQGVIEASEDISGGSTGSDQVVREITLEVLRYLQKEREGSKSDIQEKVYPRSRHKEDHTPESWWKCASKGLKEIGKKEIVDTPGKGQSIYTFEG